MIWPANCAPNITQDMETLLVRIVHSDISSLRENYVQQLSSLHYKRDDLRVAYKIACDPFYKGAFQHYGTLAALHEAGYFDDGLELEALQPYMDPRWFTTPLYKIINNIQRNKKNNSPRVVLLSTGGFAPVHDGHIAMMNIARTRLTESGYDVVGGFFSPSHDSYVSKKCEGTFSFSAARRLDILNDMLQNDDWLAADPWESLYTPTAICFTDVILRLQMYLRYNLPEHKIQVAYVFGSDNAYFYRTFCKQGMAVCIARPGYEENLEHVIRESVSVENNTIFFSDVLDAQQVAPALSSKAIRKFDNQQAINSAVAPFSTTDTRKTDVLDYYIRNDISWATTLWQKHYEEKTFEVAKQSCFQNIVNAFRKAFSSENTQYSNEQINIIPVNVEKQKTFLEHLKQQHNVLNLDPVTACSETAITVSRLFYLNDPRRNTGRITHRPGYSTSSIPSCLKANSYYLIDDDIVTGDTLNAVESSLPEGIKIAGRISLLDAYENGLARIWDIADARDFLLGSTASGLVVELFDGNIARAPYIPPFVSTTLRTSIPSQNVLSFACEILRINREFQSIAQTSVRLKDTDIGFYRLMCASGFSSESTVLEIIDWYQEMLLCNCQ